VEFNEALTSSRVMDSLPYNIEFAKFSYKLGSEHNMIRA